MPAIFSTMSTSWLIETNSLEPRLSGSVDVAPGEHLGAVDAIVDVLEAAGLVAVAPDFDGVVAGELRFDDLAADGGGGLFAAAVLRAVRAVDVVVAGDAGLDAEVFAEVAAHPLAEELLPAVAVLGHGGVGVGFLQGGDVRDRAACRRCRRRRRRHRRTAGRRLSLAAMQQVGVDQHAEHAERFVVLDEAHAAHVGGQVVDDGSALEGAVAGVLSRRSSWRFSTSGNR